MKEGVTGWQNRERVQKCCWLNFHVIPVCLSDTGRASQAVNAEALAGQLMQSSPSVDGKPGTQGEKQPVQDIMAPAGLESRSVGPQPGFLSTDRSGLKAEPCYSPRYAKLSKLLNCVVLSSGPCRSQYLSFRVVVGD